MGPTVHSCVYSFYAYTGLFKYWVNMPKTKIPCTGWIKIFPQILSSESLPNSKTISLITHRRNCVTEDKIIDSLLTEFLSRLKPWKHISIFSFLLYVSHKMKTGSKLISAVISFCFVKLDICYVTGLLFYLLPNNYTTLHCSHFMLHCCHMDM